MIISGIKGLRSEFDCVYSRARGSGKKNAIEIVGQFFKGGINVRYNTND